MSPPVPVAFNPWVVAALCVSAAIALCAPLAAAFLVWRRTRVGWKYFAFGALVFFVSQIVLRLPWQIPLGMWVLGQAQGRPLVEWSWLACSALTAGLFEEVARYFGYRRLCRDERSYRVGLMYGLGHGGVESILLVGLSIVGAVVTYVLYTHNALPTAGVPADKVAALHAQMASLTPLAALAGGVERLFALTLQVGFSMLVLQAFIRNDRRWVWIAVAGHAAVDFAAAALMKLGGIAVTEAALAVMAAGAAWLIWKLRPAAPGTDAPAAAAG